MLRRARVCVSSWARSQTHERARDEWVSGRGWSARTRRGRFVQNQQLNGGVLYVPLNLKSESRRVLSYTSRMQSHHCILINLQLHRGQICDLEIGLWARLVSQGKKNNTDTDYYVLYTCKINTHHPHFAPWKTLWWHCLVLFKSVLSYVTGP